MGGSLPGAVRAVWRYSTRFFFQNTPRRFARDEFSSDLVVRTNRCRLATSVIIERCQPSHGIQSPALLMEHDAATSLSLVSAPLEVRWQKFFAGARTDTCGSPKSSIEM